VVLDQGRVADTGTHEELTERCPLYRQLITGPDEEPVAGLEAGLDAQVPLIRPRAGRTVEEVLDGRRQAMAAAAGTVGAGGRGAMGRSRGAGAGNVTGTFASLPPSPELLARVDELPPAKDVPEVELGPARAADRQFSLRRLLRPLAVALVIGLILDGLDAVAGWRCPRWSETVSTTGWRPSSSTRSWWSR